MEGGYGPVAAYLLAGFGLAVATLFIAYILRPHDPYPEKLTTYECGCEPVGEAHTQFHIRYYIFALIFVVFDVETIYLYPWAATFRSLSRLMGSFVFVEMLVFLAILVAGFAYAWRKGVLEWV